MVLTWRLRDARNFDFRPNTSIPGVGYLLLVGCGPVNDPASLAAFRARYNNLSLTVRIVGLLLG